MSETKNNGQNLIFDVDHTRFKLCFFCFMAIQSYNKILSCEKISLPEIK
jgi:hypothetical protein